MATLELSVHFTVNSLHWGKTELYTINYREVMHYILFQFLVMLYPDNVQSIQTNWESAQYRGLKQEVN